MTANSHVREPTPDRPGSAGEAGFTLIELIVATTLSVVLLLAVLQGGDVFAKASKSSGDIAGAQEIGRATLREMTNTLRQSRAPGATVSPLALSPVDSAGNVSRSDVVAAVYLDGGDTAGWVRYCVAADGHTLLRGEATGSAYPPAGDCSTSTPATGWRYAVVIKGLLQDADRLFDTTTDSCVGYATSCARPPAAIRTIGIRLSVQSSSSDARRLVLRSAVSLRNRPVTP